MRIIPEDLVPFVFADTNGLYSVEGLDHTFFSSGHDLTMQLIFPQFGEKTAYLWNAKHKDAPGIVFKRNWGRKMEIDNIQYDIEYYDTIHTFGYHGLFKPSIVEAIHPIELENHRSGICQGCPIYITTVYAGMSKTQQNHCGITVLLVPNSKK